MAESGPLVDKVYLKEHCLQVYLEDAISELLSNRQEGNTMNPCKFFKEYFTSVHQGTHVLFREFDFVSATPYNRLCVLKAIIQIYKSLFYQQDAYNVNDYHSILQLVWPDFPMQIVQEAFIANDSDKKNDENCIKFLDFIKALKSSFCTGDFDYEANIIAEQLDDKIDEFSKILAQNGDSVINLCEADSLVNDDDDTAGKPSPWSSASNILSALEFKQILNINDSDSVSSEEPISSGKLSRSSSESKVILKKTKQKRYY